MLDFRPKVVTILTRYWIRTNKIGFRICPKTIQDPIFIENLINKLNSNSLERHKVLKLKTQLPSPWINITKIIQAFQNVVFVGELRERWTEIKKLQSNLVKEFES